MIIRARVTVTLKNGVLDPQGKAISGSLAALGFEGVHSVRQGKVFDIELESTDRAGAEADLNHLLRPAHLKQLRRILRSEADLKAMCDKLLANTVIEDYSVEVA